MLRASRTTTEAQVRWVYPKILLFVVGASLGLAGIASGIDWLLTAGIAVLAAGFVLKLIVGRREERAERMRQDSMDAGYGTFDPGSPAFMHQLNMHDHHHHHHSGDVGSSDSSSDTDPSSSHGSADGWGGSDDAAGADAGGSDGGGSDGGGSDGGGSSSD